MCFYENLDCDISFDVFDEDRKHVANEVVECFECWQGIPPGESHTRIYMQEHEECQSCELEEGFEPCEKHNYGEIEECFVCQTCQKIVDAIAAVEKDEGCPSHVSRPLLGGLREVFVEHSDAEKYAKRAVKMFPELAGHTWFDLAMPTGNE